MQATIDIEYLQTQKRRNIEECSQQCMNFDYETMKKEQREIGDVSADE